MPVCLGWQLCEHWFSRMSLLRVVPPTRVQQAFRAGIQACGFFKSDADTWDLKARGAASERWDLLISLCWVEDTFFRCLPWNAVASISPCLCMPPTICLHAPLSKLPTWSFVKTSHVEFSITTSRVRLWYWEWVIVTKFALMPDSVCLVACICPYLDVTVPNLFSCLTEA